MFFSIKFSSTRQPGVLKGPNNDNLTAKLAGRTRIVSGNMGKARRSRGRENRSDPIAKPVKPLSDPELIKLRETTVLPVLKDLQSPDPRSRTAAAGAIANIVQDARVRRLLLREQVILPQSPPL